MPVDVGENLLRSLREHNPWWEEGTDAFALPSRAKSDFYHLARPDREGSQFEDQRLLGLVGRRGVGKTTLLHQFIHQRIQAGAAPEQFLYLPMDADPLYQLNSDDQLHRAVRHYETRVLGRSDVAGPQFVLVDDVHRVEHPNKSQIEGWGAPIAELLDRAYPAADGQATLSSSTESRSLHVVVTASAGAQVRQELDRVGFNSDHYAVQPILPEKFRDYLFSLYPELEADETRVSPSSIRSGENSLPASIERGSVDSLVEELQAKYEKVAPKRRTIQSQVVDYLAMGGTISYDRDGVVESAADLTATDYERLREDVRHALYQEVPNFESIQTIADLERLCALAARDCAAEPLRYKELVDLFDVDRRTITGSYLPALEKLYLLDGVTEYNNQRPRSVRLYLRDTGLVTALADGDVSAIRNDLDREADLARIAAFDHTMRFSYGINAAQGTDPEPLVQFWRGRRGEVDFVFEVGTTPVPIALAYRSGERQEALTAVEEFQDTFSAPVGMVLTGDTIRGTDSISETETGIIQLPFWLFLLIC